MKCQYCGKKLHGRKRKFCNEKCRKRSYTKLPPREVTCARCGKVFLQSGQGRNSLYCGKVCRKHARRDYHRKYKREWRKNRCEDAAQDEF